MANVFGPKLGLLFNANLDEFYGDNLRKFLQALDQLIMGSVINASTVVPPVSPSPGDAYLISSTPSGAWSGFPVNSIAVWDTQVTLSGTNTQAPAWVNYIPNAGWTVWNVATTSFNVYNGSTWVPFSGGADFPVNTNITSMTGIPNTSINTSGYTYNDGTRPPTYVGDAALIGNTGNNGFLWGSGTWTSPVSGGGAIIGNGPWTGLAASGAGFGAFSTAGATAMVANGVQTTGQLQGNFVEALTLMTSLNLLSVGGSGILANASDTTLSISGQGMSTVGKPAILFGSGTGSPTNGVGLIGFGSTYFTQTTVGAAGAASALPVTPKKYIQIVDTDGSVVVFPVYASV